MRRDLPPVPHLDHLKKQAKDLLEAHRRGEPEAVARLRDALPSLRGLSEEAVLRATLALHDAQSAIAREYGAPSWSALREEVLRRRTAGFPRELVRTLMSGHPNAPLPAPVLAAIEEAWARRAPDAGATDVPATLPLLAVRNALVMPGAIVPLQIGRAPSLTAIDAALTGDPPLLAIFAQRDPAVEEVSFDALHATGCLALVTHRLPDAAGRAFVIVRGLSWVCLRALRSVAGHAVGDVVPAGLDGRTDEGAEVAPRFAALRDRARRLASALPEPAQALTVIDAIDDPERLADLVVANLPSPVEDKVRYAAATDLAAKLDLAVTLADALLAATP